ncbi:hypothetical protein PInf_009612 [Phytophthora infestans]|nr:hypothetical protein PInf_009612 [Phytophthora infestans]
MDNYENVESSVTGSVELERTDSETSLEENNSPERDAKEIVTAAEEPEITPSYARVFSKEELDALQEGKDMGATDEKEEYDKELEDRLFPLDEVELKRRQDEIAERSKELSLAELSTLLGVPEDKLERTRESSPGRLSTPEYWLEWYRKTLASTGAAKRANRNFKEEPPDHDSSVVATDSDGRDEGGGTDPKEFPLKEIKVETVHVPESSGSTPAEEQEVVDLTVIEANIALDFNRQPGNPSSASAEGHDALIANGITEEIQKGSLCPGCHAEELRTEKLMEEGSVPIWKQDLETRTRDTLKRFLDPSAVELENLLVRRIMELYRRKDTNSA